VANGDVTVMAEQKIECDNVNEDGSNVTDGGNMQKCPGVFEGAPR